MAKIKFSDAPESKPQRYVQDAGIHRGFKVASIELITEKDGKPVKNLYLKLVLQQDNLQYTHFYFQPPVQVDEVKFTRDKYKEGVKVGKLTPEEQIEHEFMELFMFYEQLALAWQAPQEKRAEFRSLEPEPAEAFVALFNGFKKYFPLEKYGDKLIDFKTLWSNSKKNQTSRLEIPKPSSRDLIFCPFLKDQQSLLCFSDYEQKNCLVRAYAPKAPEGNGAVVDNNPNVISTIPHQDVGPAVPSDDLF